MAGKTLKEVAKEKGLAFQSKAIFGWLNGYYITLRFFLDVIRLHVYLPAQQAAEEQSAKEEQHSINSARTEAVLALEDTLKEFKLARVRTINEGQSVGIEFRCNARFLKHLGEFMDTATRKLAENSIPTARVCSQCAKVMDHDEVPVLIKEDVFPMHDHCADDINRQEAWDGSKQKGSLLPGILGAAMAAIAGAIPWALVFALGYMASIVGILIGLIVSKGYDLLHGRQGRVKIAVVLLFILLSVALGQVAGTSYQLSQYYDETKAGLSQYEEMAYSKTDAILLFWKEDVWSDSETMREILSNFGLGVFFALLGCFKMFRQLARDTAPKRPRRLDVSL
jgi:hypothetical protein